MTQATVRITDHDQRRVLGAQMAKLGVRLLNKYGRVLQCEVCTATWSPQPTPSGSSRAVSGAARTGVTGRAFSGNHQNVRSLSICPV